MYVNEKSYVNLIWRDWLQQADKKPLDRWLKAWFKQHRNLSRQQKLDLSLAMFDAMRFLQAADFLETCFVKSQIMVEVNDWDKNWQLTNLNELNPLTFWNWVDLLGQHHQLKPLAALESEPFSQSSASLRRKQWFESLDKTLLETAPVNLLIAGIRPMWQALLIQRQILTGWSDNKLVQFINYQLVSPPLWLRLTQPHQFESGRQKLLDTLNQQGIIARNLEQGICIEGGRDITTTHNYKQGEFEIQDLASQQIAQAMNIKPGEKVWDCCAGAGGKSLAIASRMNNKGSIVATDIHEYKLAEVKKRAKRAGYHNIRSFVWDGEKPLRLPKEAAQQRGFDWVLIDAPCSSAGTWRRNPDAKWRFNEQDTQQQLKIQRQILSQAHHAVRDGGYLVYATCSWQVSENEAQVAEFLAKNTEFELISQQLLGAPEQNSDTMFVAVMRKQKTP